MKNFRRSSAGLLIAGLSAGIFSLTMDDVRNASANTWIPVPNSRLDASPEAVPNAFPQAYQNTLRGNGFDGLMTAWNGGIYDTKRDRFVIWGGGHNDYRGNEVYVFELATFAWKRITDPTLNPANCSDPNSDGTANTRHTYGGLSYIAHADRFFVLGGALNCLSGSCGARLTWAFDFDQLKWNNRNPSGTIPQTSCGNSSAYDPVGKKVYFGDPNSNGGFYSYDYDANRWTKLTGDDLYEYAMAVDAKRGLAAVVGQGNVYVYDIRQASVSRQTWATTGGSAFVSKDAAGLDYDPVADRIVGWDGGSVYALNMDTKAWTVHTAAGAPASISQGTYGRWRYVPGVNAFITVNGVGQNVYFFKLTAGTGVEKAPRSVDNPGFSISAFPNPAREKVTLRAPGSSRLALYDTRGRRVAQFASSGVWDARTVPAGVYLARAQRGGTAVEKAIFIVR